MKQIFVSKVLNAVNKGANNIGRAGEMISIVGDTLKTTGDLLTDSAVDLKFRKTLETHTIKLAEAIYDQSEAIGASLFEIPGLEFKVARLKVLAPQFIRIMDGYKPKDFESRVDKFQEEFEPEDTDYKDV